MPHFNIILMILVAWLSQAQGQEIYPAKIYANRNRGKLEFTCSTYGLKAGTEKNSNFYIYLCRNGIGIDRKSSCQDAIFHMDDATTDNTGNYSCVFSVHKYNLEVVKGNGINSIFITVNDSFIPAEIALTETSVKTGTDAEFQCTSLKSPKRNQKGNIYAYLYKNSTVIQMSIWDTVKNKARFTLKEVTMQDAGTYNCFLMSEPCPFPKKVHGVNEVYLHITDIFLMISTSVSPSEGDSLEIFPAKIFGSSTAKVGENLVLKCSISNIQSSNTDVHMYLCKNGAGERLELLGNKDEHTFTLTNISLRDSGNYSCVYSFTKHLTKNVIGSGINSIHVQVTGDSLEIFPAQIFGSSTAKVGENLVLKCSISNVQSSKKAVHMYLCKNGVGERLERLGNKDEHTFTLRNISLRDSGDYSCVYSFTKHLTKNVIGSGINSIHVQVTDDKIQPTDSVKTAMVSLVTLLLVAVIFIKMYRYRMTIYHKLCQNQGQSEPANTRNNEGLGQVNQTVNRNELSNDMAEYATIPEVRGSIRPLTACDAESVVVYSFASPCGIYSLVEHPENNPKMQREPEQPAEAAVYAQVLKEKRK